MDSSHKRGLGDLLDQHAPDICLLERREMHDTLFSWSTTRLPGTVFTDHVDSPEVLVRDLIHEAGHHWFNDALTAASVSSPESPSFYSPWQKKNTIRPAFEFLHACWAFSLTAIYSAQVVDATPSPVQGFLRDYLTDQGRHLRDALSALADAVTLITSVPLRDQLSKAVDAALRCTPGAVHLLPAQ
ncbi:HEXXH motif-containing putative peptide modification protein [Kitasatospora sp. YST-16]|uniref:aKG-HExxH-type peptide beta-hydroxylase n=1 Tax=Kitasatospora sp. YST-16 TaxID=2998080 RepID=UPI0022840D8B|nr:HEXXH motif-containing putative peptide modification protein [Kitasatospora sp. YST-16]WAL74645.1 HEXXH motif-containing putative peptide modification protein [Kitasatospora sp. YST-16]WNW40703.1 HEXXH motif-containing putative peptide modification protein [Streptomyces sp. Li-HN-5-13]